MPEVVIIGADGTEHVFPAGFDPKRAASIVRGGASPAAPPTDRRAPTGAENAAINLLGVRPAALGLYDPTADVMMAGPRQMGRGVQDIVGGEYSRGGHNILSGLGKTAALALPGLAPGILAAPMATAGAIGGGLVGQELAQQGAMGMGATPDQTALAGDIGGLAGGFGGTKVPGILAPLVKNPVARVAATEAANVASLGTTGRMIRGARHVSRVYRRTQDAARTTGEAGRDAAATAPVASGQTVPPSPPPVTPPPSAPPPTSQSALQLELLKREPNWRTTEAVPWESPTKNAMTTPGIIEPGESQLGLNDRITKLLRNPTPENVKEASRLAKALDQRAHIGERRAAARAAPAATTPKAALPSTVLTEDERAMLTRMRADLVEFVPLKEKSVNPIRLGDPEGTRSTYVPRTAGTPIAEDVRVIGGQHVSNTKLVQAVDALIAGKKITNKVQAAVLDAARGYIEKRPGYKGPMLPVPKPKPAVSHGDIERIRVFSGM